MSPKNFAASEENTELGGSDAFLRTFRLIKIALDIRVSLYHGIFMRTTLSLDDDIYEAASTLAKGSGRTLGQIVSMLVRTALSASKEPASNNEFPKFTVESNAPLIPGNRASELIDDE